MGARRRRRRLRGARRLRRRPGPALARGRGASTGLALRLHGDQFTEMGAIELAIEMSARSVDHLEATGPEGVADARRLGRHGRPPARRLRSTLRRPDAARARAGRRRRRDRARDRLQPGSSFCESLPLVMNLACTQMEITPAEALAACTVNAAHVLGQAERIGRLRVGYAGRRRGARCARLAPPRLPPGRAARSGTSSPTVSWALEGAATGRLTHRLVPCWRGQAQAAEAPRQAHSPGRTRGATGRLEPREQSPERVPRPRSDRPPADAGPGALAPALDQARRALHRHRDGGPLPARGSKHPFRAAPAAGGDDRAVLHPVRLLPGTLMYRSSEAARPNGETCFPFASSGGPRE